MEAEAREYVATLRVGVGLGLGFTAIGAALAAGSWAHGDAAAALYVGAPAAALSAVGTALYATLPRRRVRIGDSVELDGAPLESPRLGPITLRGEGFTTTRAFALRWGEPEQVVWLTARHFPRLDALYADLATVAAPPDPAEQTAAFVRPFSW